MIVWHSTYAGLGLGEGREDDDECKPCYCNCVGSSGYDMEDFINVFYMFGGRGFR